MRFNELARMSRHQHRARSEQGSAAKAVSRHHICMARQTCMVRHNWTAQRPPRRQHRRSYFPGLKINRLALLRQHVPVLLSSI